MKYDYAEVGIRYLTFPMPNSYDDWGFEGMQGLEIRIEKILKEYRARGIYNELPLKRKLLEEIQRQPKQWKHSFCVMDDYGNAIPVDTFPHTVEEGPVLAPDYNKDITRYILYYPTVH